MSYSLKRRKAFTRWREDGLIEIDSAAHPAQRRHVLSRKTPLAKFTASRSELLTFLSTPQDAGADFVRALGARTENCDASVHLRSRKATLPGTVPATRAPLFQRSQRGWHIHGFGRYGVIPTQSALRAVRCVLEGSYCVSLTRHASQRSSARTKVISNKFVVFGPLLSSSGHVEQ